jgi:segregation and condensation protein A
MTTAPYELSLDRFQGPLDKLLELIEARELEVSEISLAEVTDDFLKYLESLKAPEGAAEDPISMRLLADFIVVASRLVFIKSKALLPSFELTEEEASDIRDLESRLRLYRELKPMFKAMQATWGDRRPVLGRPYFMNTVTPAAGSAGADRGARVFYPGERLTAAALAGSLEKLFAAFERFALENDTIRERIVTLEEKIAEIVSRIRELAATSFQALAKDQSRAETIITFLAVLHLAREQVLTIEQGEHLSDIMITRQEPHEA